MQLCAMDMSTWATLAGKNNVVCYSNILRYMSQFAVHYMKKMIIVMDFFS